MEKGKSKVKGISDSAGSSRVSPNGTIRGNNTSTYDVYKLLRRFWPYQAEKIANMSPVEFRETKISQELPLARIKKIMKLDDDVKTQMISAEAPVLFAKACEMFIEELTVRAWVHTEDNKRKTLQKNDVALAISKHDQFDFLIDIVPREEIAKGSSSGVSNSPGACKRASTSPAGCQAESNMPMFLQVAAPTTSAPPAMQAIQLSNGQILQTQALGGQPMQLVQGANGELQLVNVSSNAQSQAAQVIPVSSTPRHQQQTQSQQSATGQVSSSSFAQAFQQIVAPDGTVHHLPVQLSPAQLNYLKQHLSGNSGQQQVHVLQNSSTPTSSTAPRVQTQQQTAFFIQTSGPVDHAQQQTGVQLQMISTEQQASEATASSSTR